MQAISSTGKPMSVGKSLAVFTNTPEPVGAEFNVVDRDGNVLNVARVTNVALSSDIKVSSHKYVVQAIVVQEVSEQTTDPLVARVYWN